MKPAVTAVMPSRKNKPKRNDVPAKIDAEVMRTARIVAAYEGVELAELVSQILKPVLMERLATHQATAQPKKPRKSD